MNRKLDREARQARLIEGIVDGVLENWGIEMHRYDDEPEDKRDNRPAGERFAGMVGEGESVEYEEIYGMICDVAAGAYNAGKQAPLIEQLNAEAVAEVARLRSIILRAYGTEGWDIGSMKNVLIPGLEGYEQSGWAEPVEQALHFTAAEYEVGFDEFSDRNSWWVKVVLIGEHGERATHTMTDIDAEQFVQKIDEQVREGRKDWG